MFTIHHQTHLKFSPHPARSTNYGETFVDISSNLTLNSENGEKTAVISKFYHHPESNCHYVFTGKRTFKVAVIAPYTLS